MRNLVNDFRYALRGLLRTPAFTIAAVLTLALGIGANTAIFSVVDGVLLRPAPFEAINRLAMVWETDRKSGTTREPGSVPDFLDFQQRSQRFSRIAAFTSAEVSLTPDQGEPSRLPALGVSHDFLPMVGIRPIVGRTFTADDDRPGPPTGVIISEALWERLFSRDPKAIGRTLRINDLPIAIVGVLPSAADFGTLQILSAAAYGRGFAERGDRVRVDIWYPLAPDPVSLPRDTHPIFLLGRLAPGATAGQAQQEMEGITADLERAYPENDGRGAFIEPLSDVVFSRVRPALLVLMGAVGLVLLVACTNIANLLLARGMARMREVTVRTALGASMKHLTRQFLVESAVLTAIGTLGGIALAFFGVSFLTSIAPADIPRIATLGIDGRALVLTILVSAVVALAFGLLPTLQARKLNLQPTLQGEAGRGASSGREHRRIRSVLVVSELALAVMLMAGVGLLIRSLWQLQDVDPGFRAEGVLKAEYQLPETRYPQSFSNFPAWPEIRHFTAELQRRVAALPGVEAVAVAGHHPLEAGYTSSIRVVGREAEAEDWPEPSIRLVDAGYFGTMRVPVKDGRGFTESDDGAANPVIVINQASQRRYFADQPALGQRINLWGADRLVVGIVADERFHGLAEPSAPGVYMPLAQIPTSGGSLLVRAARDPVALAPAIRAIVRELDPALPLFGVEALRQTLADSLGQRRFTMIVLGAFALVALLLAVVGVHGVLSYSVAQRSREIGIRMALGADARGVRAMVLTQGAWLTGAGLLLGLAGALMITRVLATLLYGVGPRDPLTFVGVAFALGGVALLATWLPARRAALVDPMMALRTE